MTAPDPGRAYDQLDDLRGTGAVRVISGDTVAQLCVDGRWYDGNRIVPLDAHGPWMVLKRHKDGM